MKNIYTSLLKEGDIKKKLALATILETRGSAPQVQGASAVFSDVGLLSGTLGGGVLEGDATEKSHTAISNGKSMKTNVTEKLNTWSVRCIDCSKRQNGPKSVQRFMM